MPAAHDDPDQHADRDFRLLWAGQTVSQVGDAVTFLALPLTAVLTLHASTFQVGGLEAATASAWVLLSLPAGAWVDRLRRRPVLIACDLVRAAVLVSVPLAWGIGALTLAQLYAVAFLAGAATVMFSAGYTAYLPTLVPQDRITAANARLQTTSEAADIVGAGVGGVLVSAFTGPGALLVDAVSFVIGAVGTATIGHREPRPQPADRHLRQEIAEGLRTTFGRPALRALTLFAGALNLTFSALGTVSIVLLARQLRFSGAVIGAIFILAGVGGVLGGLVAPRVIDRIGLRRALWLPGVCTMPFALLQPLVDRGAGVLPYGVGLLLVDSGVIMFNVAMATYVQTTVPQQLLGRTASAIRLVSRGSVVVGGLLAGVLASWLGLRGAMWLLTSVLAVLPLGQALTTARRLGAAFDGDLT